MEIVMDRSLIMEVVAAFNSVLETFINFGGAEYVSKYIKMSEKKLQKESEKKEKSGKFHLITIFPCYPLLQFPFLIWK